VRVARVPLPARETRAGVDDSDKRSRQTDVARRARFWPLKKQNTTSPLKRSVPVSENAVSPVAPISSGFTFFFRGFFSRFRFSPGVGTPHREMKSARAASPGSRRASLFVAASSDVNESTRGKKSFFSVYNIANVTR
jgi:hypothetical protein